MLLLGSDEAAIEVWQQFGSTGMYGVTTAVNTAVVLKNC